jgi:hypothetical protein
VTAKGKGHWSGRRVELNAMTSGQLVEWIERKLTEHGVKKLVPRADTLAQAYQRATRLARIQELLDAPDENPATVPPDLGERVAAVLAQHPECSWDDAIWDLIPRAPS